MRDTVSTSPSSLPDDPAALKALIIELSHDAARSQGRHASKLEAERQRLAQQNILLTPRTVPHGTTGRGPIA
jgi:hypothetical protein